MDCPSSIIIFGATGDLALHMLYPSLYFLDAEDHLPENMAVVGCARSALSDDQFAERARKLVKERAGSYYDDAAWQKFRKRLRYVRLDANEPETYKALLPFKPHERETIFYLSTSPSLYEAIARNLKAAGLVGPESRVIIEKPIGHDLESCEEINTVFSGIFSEKHVFRIDHYLGKEAVQNLLALRFANVLFEPIWNKESIEHVQITVAESNGVDGRWGYYDEYGALRDMVQNHLMQLLCLVAMEPPSSLDPDAVRNEKVKVLRSLKHITARDVDRKTVRGQYRAGISDGKPVPGYLEEEGGKPSDTETFVAIATEIENWRWAGVPFYLRTGKRLAARKSEIVIQFRCVPHSIFAGTKLVANRLTISLQPEEEISLSLMNKTPSLEENGMELKQVALNLSLTAFYAQQKRPRRRIAYERLLLGAIQNNATLFVRNDEAEAAWAWIDSIMDAWAETDQKPAPYPAGSWGPAGAFALIERSGHSWCE